MHRRRGRGARIAFAVAIAALLAPASGSAATALLAVGPVDDARPALVRQLRQAICAAVECVPWGTVSNQHRLDPTRLRAAGVDGALVGAVAGPADRQLLRLSLLGPRGGPAARYRFALGPDGTLAARALEGLVEELERRLETLAERRRRAEASLAPPRARAAVPAPSPEALPERSPPDTSALHARAPEASPREPEPFAATAPGPESLPFTSPPPVPSPPARAPSPPPAGEASGAPETELSSSPWLAVELGATVGRSELAFQGAAPSPAPLRGHRIPALVAPGVRVELQPAAPWSPGALAGLSLQASYVAAVGVRTDVRGVAHPTRLSWVSAGAAWRSAPPGGARRGWSAELSWERRDVVTSPAVAGLPDRRLSGAKASLGVAQPVGRAWLFVSAGYIRWLPAPDLVSGASPLLSSARAWGIDAEAGVGVRLGGPFSVRLSVEYAGTRYTLVRDPAGLHAAQSAREDQAASRVAVRAEL